MNRDNFPYIAAALGLVFALVLAFAAPAPDATETRLPLLMLLLMAELGFLFNVAGAAFGIAYLRRAGLRPAMALTVLLCAALAVWLALRGLALWPGWS